MGNGKYTRVLVVMINSKPVRTLNTQTRADEICWNRRASKRLWGRWGPRPIPAKCTASLPVLCLWASSIWPVDMAASALPTHSAPAFPSEHGHPGDSQPWGPSPSSLPFFFWLSRHRLRPSKFPAQDQPGTEDQGTAVSLARIIARLRHKHSRTTDSGEEDPTCLESVLPIIGDVFSGDFLPES